MEIVNQFDDKFGVTMLSETSTEIKQLFFIDYNMLHSTAIEGITAADLQKDKLYLYKLHTTTDGESAELKSKELYNTGVNYKLLSYIKNSKTTLIDGIECNSITIQNDDTFNVGDTLLSLDNWIANEEGDDTRYDYNGAMYEVVKVEGKVIYLRTKDNVNKHFEQTQTLYLYNKAK